MHKKYSHLKFSVTKGFMYYVHFFGVSVSHTITSLLVWIIRWRHGQWIQGFACRYVNNEEWTWNSPNPKANTETKIEKLNPIERISNAMTAIASSKTNCISSAVRLSFEQLESPSAELNKTWSTSSPNDWHNLSKICQISQKPKISTIIKARLGA